MNKTRNSSPIFAGRFNLVSLVVLSLLFSTHARAASSWDGKKQVDYIVTVDPDRPDAMYHKGETVTFTVQVQHNNEQSATDGTIDWVLSKDGVNPPISKGTATLQDGKAVVTGTLDEPGFLRCDATFKNGKDSFTGPAEAAFDPTDIKPSMPVPDDFDAF